MTYQHELKFVKQNDSRMKTAEREINRLSYAFMILKDAKFPCIPVPPKSQKTTDVDEEEKKEVLGGLDRDSLINLCFDELPQIRSLPGKEDRVLIVKAWNGKYEGWHPRLGEFDLRDSNSNSGPHAPAPKDGKDAAQNKQA